METETFKLFILPDVHTPYHDRQAWACALAALRGWRPHMVVQLGDFSSFDSVSSHPQDPALVLPLDQEVAESNEALDELDAACRDAGVARGARWMLEGNHETRVSRYAQRLAPQLRPFIDWRDMLHLDRRGWQTKSYKQSLRVGEMLLTHDVGRAGVNAARQSLLDVGDNVVFGHTHRVQVVYQGTTTGSRHVGATLGWLGDAEAIDYRHADMVRRDWQHGFGVAHFVGGAFWLQAVPIIDEACVVDGVVYRG